MSAGVPGLVEEAYCGWEEAVLVARGFGLDRPQPLSRGECCEQVMTGMGGVGHDLLCSSQCPGAVQILEGWEVVPNHLFSPADDTLQSTFVLDSSSSVPDADGGGEDGLNDGSVEVHHHCLWQVEFLQLPQEVHPLLCLLDEGADVLLPFEVLGDDGTQEFERYPQCCCF